MGVVCNLDRAAKSHDHLIPQIQQPHMASKEKSSTPGSRHPPEQTGHSARLLRPSLPSKQKKKKNISVTEIEKKISVTFQQITEQDDGKMFQTIFPFCILH